MKNFLIFLSVLCVTYVTVVAQDKDQDRDQKKDQTRDQLQLQDHILMKSGKVYQVKNQKEILIDKPITLENGTQVNADGTCQLKDRQQIRLRDGECLDMDGNQYKSQHEFQERMQIRAQAMNQEHLMMQGNQLYRIKNQQKSQVQEQLTLQNGMTVKPDGTGEKNGKQFRLRDGECLDMDGNQYESQNRFREKAEQHRREKIEREKGKEKMKSMAPEKRRKNN